jgi:hypothetical protein
MSPVSASAAMIESFRKTAKEGKQNFNGTFGDYRTLRVSVDRTLETELKQKSDS